jgi:hypothetical protein
MPHTLIAAILGCILIAAVYARGVTIFTTTPAFSKLVLALVCDCATLFVWQLGHTSFFDYSIGLNNGVERFILVTGTIILFFFYMVLDVVVFNWRVWFPKPVGFALKNLTPKSNSRNYVYADSIPVIKVKGDGWVRR